MNEQLSIALIAAGSALLGAAVGQLGPLLQHWLSTRHERRVALRQRYEQMATLAGDLAVHLVLGVDGIRRSAIPEGRDLLRSATQMQMLSLLYFPALKEPMEALRTAAIRMDMALRSKADAEESMAATDEFATARKDALLAIAAHADRYT